MMGEEKEQVRHSGRIRGTPSGSTRTTMKATAKEQDQANDRLEALPAKSWQT